MIDDEPIAAARRVPLDLAATDGSEYTGTAPTGSEVLISIQGGAWQQASGTVAKIRDGDFYYEAARAETRGRGMRLLRVAKSGMQTAIFEFQCGNRRAAEADASARRIPIILEATNGTPLPGLDPDDFDVEVSVNGGAFVGGSGTAAEILDENDVGYGAYYYEPTRTEHARGHSLFNVNATGAVEYKYELVVDQAYLPTIANATTAAAIRDRAIEIVKAIVPEYLEGDRFIPYRNEGNGDFVAWCEAHPVACQRRFQIRYDGADQPPLVADNVHEEQLVKLTSIFAYAQTARAGRDQALDRDDMIDSDRKLLNRAIGMYSRGSFTAESGADACWTDGEIIRAPGTGVDFLIVTGTFRYREAL